MSREELEALVVELRERIETLEMHVGNLVTIANRPRALSSTPMAGTTMGS